VLWAAFAGFGLLAGCGNSTTGQEFRAALQSAGQVVSPGDLPPAAAVGRASYQMVPGPLVFVTLPDSGAAAPMVPFGENRGFRTWSTAEKQTLTLRGGIVSSTRGFGDDLMQARVDPVMRAVESGSGSGVSRVTWHLDGNDDFIVRRLSCAVRTEGRETITLVSGERIDATRVTETCTEGGESFVNTYWKQANGTVRRSRQWISPIVGHAEIEILRL
jgi:hypothetical protein